MLSKKRVDYQTYIKSDKWRSLHKPFLKRSGHRCAMFPWLRVGRIDGKYHKYNLHHITYENLGDEKYWWDVLPVSKFAHKHIIHGILSMYKRPEEQEKYPNFCQSVAHAWCRLPIPFKSAIALLLLTAAFAIPLMAPQQPQPTGQFTIQ